MTLNGAIMQLVEMRENSMMPMVFKPYFDKVIETISECEEPCSQPQWIPCSERLPEEAGEYYCTCTDARRLLVTLIKWQPRMKSWNLSGARAYWKVIAWMPKPSPYPSENEESE